MNSANLPDIVSYSRPRWLPCASPPPFWIMTAIMARHALLRDEVVEDARQRHVRLAELRAVVHDDERRLRAALVLRGDVDRDRALIGLARASRRSASSGLLGSTVPNTSRAMPG